MDIQAVLIETKIKDTVKASSATLVKQRYVLTTCHILLQILQQNIELLHELPDDQLHLYTKKPIIFHVFWKNDPSTSGFTVKRARLFALFKSKVLSDFHKNDFRDWSANPDPGRTNKNYYVNLNEAISAFLVLAVEGVKATEEDLKRTLDEWLNAASLIKVAKCDQILSVSSPFGSREFLNSISEGIISATLKGSSLFLSDCSSAPGCEGGLIYLRDRQKPFGIIVSSFNWWRKDWVGFTLIIDVTCLLSGLVLNGICKPLMPNAECLDNFVERIETCLVQIKCGPNWGTAALVSKEKGIFITNSHVISCGEKVKIKVFWKSNVTTAKVIYKTDISSNIDFAVIKTNIIWSDLRAISYDTIGSYRKGQVVYAAGYPLLSSTSASLRRVTVTRGIISACDPCTIQTTCSVYPGFSGGGIFTTDGIFQGLIVSNTKLDDAGETFSQFNMAIPLSMVWKPVQDYLKCGGK